MFTIAAIVSDHVYTEPRCWENLVFECKTNMFVLYVLFSLFVKSPIAVQFTHLILPLTLFLPASQVQEYQHAYIPRLILAVLLDPVYRP